jgi:hypothetical protein
VDSHGIGPYSFREERHGVLFLSTRALLDAVYEQHPDARADVAAYLLEK